MPTQNDVKAQQEITFRLLYHFMKANDIAYLDDEGYILAPSAAKEDEDTEFDHKDGKGRDYYAIYLYASSTIYGDQTVFDPNADGYVHFFQFEDDLLAVKVQERNVPLFDGDKVLLPSA